MIDRKAPPANPSSPGAPLALGHFASRYRSASGLFEARRTRNRISGRGIKGTLIRLFLVHVAILLSGCISVRLHEKTFVPVESRQQSVNGADIHVQIEGLGGGKGAFSVSAMVYSAAMASTTGPYEVSLFAIGEAGRHETMTVHALQMRTPESGRHPLTEGKLGVAIPFSPTRQKGVVQAVFHVPGEVRAEFGRDSELQIDALISVATADHRAVKKPIRMTLKPKDRARSEFIALPSEIYHSIKDSRVPFDDLEIGANRAGWKR